MFVVEFRECGNELDEARGNHIHSNNKETVIARNEVTKQSLFSFFAPLFRLWLSHPFGTSPDKSGSQ